MFHSFLRVDWNSKSQCMLKPPDSYGSVLAGSAMIRFGHKKIGWKRDKKKGTPVNRNALLRSLIREPHRGTGCIHVVLSYSRGFIDPGIALADVTVNVKAVAGLPSAEELMLGSWHRALVRLNSVIGI